jgi:hypothetical protein
MLMPSTFTRSSAILKTSTQTTAQMTIRTSVSFGLRPNAMTRNHPPQFKLLVRF